jgi:hypothetical protein
MRLCMLQTPDIKTGPLWNQKAKMDVAQDIWVGEINLISNMPLTRNRNL